MERRHTRTVPVRALAESAVAPCFSKWAFFLIYNHKAAQQISDRTMFSQGSHPGIPRQQDPMPNQVLHAVCKVLKWPCS